MSDQKPREWWVKQVGHWPGKDEIYDAHNTSIPADAIHVIEHSAYQALAMRLKAAEEELSAIKSEAGVYSFDLSNVQHSCFKDKEIDQLKAEVELLKSRLAHFQNLHKEFHDQLTREKKITAMLREALEQVCEVESNSYESEAWPIADQALAREAEMRKEKNEL